MATGKTKKSKGPKIVIKKQQLNSISQMMTLLAATLIVIIGLRYVAIDLIAPVLLAIFLAILMMPVFRFFRRKNFSRGVSIIFMVLTFITVAGGIIIFLTVSFKVLGNALSQYIDQFRGNITQTAESFGIDETAAEAATEMVTPEAILNIVSVVFGNLGSVIFYFLVIPILAILMILQFDSFPQQISKKIIKDNPSMKRYSKFADSIMKYVVGRFKVNMITGVLFSIALLIIGVDFPFLWGALAILLSFIPYIGLVIAGTPPTLLGIAEYGIWGGIAVAGALLVINLFAENVLDPYIQGKSNKISTAAVVIALIFWTWLFGFVGAILAVPLTVLLKIILSDYRETEWIALLMEGNYETAEKQGKESKNRLVEKIGKSINRIIPDNGK